MALFNYTAKEITLKVVYYGPGFSGKTTNLQYLHSLLPANTRGKLISLTTEADRTLFFDFLPVDMGKIKDFNIRFQLYTVPGQVRYDATRRLVLKGADTVVFVADSQKEMKEQNIESLNNMRDNLTANNLDPDNIPVVFQYNKRDLKNILSIEELNGYLNKSNARFFEAVAVEGKGVEDTFRESTNIL
ncbi:MAG: GTPase domain-containing protein, partial [Nitrospirota bacterium]